MAIEFFAESLDTVFKTSAESAGLEPIDIMVELRSACEKLKGHPMSVDVFTGKLIRMPEKGVMEPSNVEGRATKSATEATSMIQAKLFGSSR